MSKAQAHYQKYHHVNTPRYHMLDNHEDNNPQWPFQIRQQNTNKSLLSQLDLLHSLKRSEYDLCLIQEPYIDFKGKTRANQNWAVIYPTTHEKHPDHTRSVILINTNMLSDAWKQIHFDHPDITAIEIQGHFSTLRVM